MMINSIHRLVYDFKIHSNKAEKLLLLQITNQIKLNKMREPNNRLSV